MPGTEAKEVERMWGRIGLVGVGAGAGVLIAVGLRLGSAPEGEVPVPAPAAAERGAEGADDAARRAERRSALAEALQAEVEARRQLADEVAWLQEEVARLGAELAAEQRRGRGRVADAGAERAPEPGRGSEEGPAEPEDGRFFDEQALIEQGVDPERAAWLHERYEELEMERLYLGDEAAREGWLFTPRHRLAHQAAEQRLIDEIGEEAYDQMLFAAGRSNRVRVGDVLSGSPASQAGIEPGDVVLRYGRRRIFQPQELRQETTRGGAGELTEVELLRDGRTVTTRVPRGPLGLRLVPEHQPPLGD